MELCCLRFPFPELLLHMSLLNAPLLSPHESFLDLEHLVAAVLKLINQEYIYALEVNEDWNFVTLLHSSLYTHYSISIMLEQ